MVTEKYLLADHEALIMHREEFKNRWKELRLRNVSYDSLNGWLKIICELKDSGISDDKITRLLEDFLENR